MQCRGVIVVNYLGAIRSPKLMCLKDKWASLRWRWGGEDCAAAKGVA